MEVAISILVSVATIASSIAAILGYLNHGKVTNINANVNGRIGQLISALEHSQPVAHGDEVTPNGSNTDSNGS